MDNSNSNYELESVAKALAATAISQSLSFCMERKYLQGIDRGEMFSLFRTQHLPVSPFFGCLSMYHEPAE